MTRDRFPVVPGRRPISRRDFNRMLAAAGVGVVASPLMTSAARANPNLTLFEWTGYEIPEFHGDFIEQHGGSPSFTIFSEEEEAYQKLRAGFRVDITHPCTYTVARWRDAGLIKPIDTSRIERWSVIPDALLSIPGVAHDGEYYMMPWDWGNSTIVYRHDLIENPRISWNLFLDESLRGRLSYFDSIDAAFMIAGAIIGVDDFTKMNQDELQEATEVLREIHKNIRYYWQDNTTMEQSMASGEIVAAYSWTSSYVTLKGEGIPVTFMLPEEGAATWCCGFVMNNNAPGDEQQAYDYLNAVLSPEAGKYLIEEYGYGHANTESFQVAEAEIIDTLGLDAGLDEFLAGTIFFGEIEPGLREQMIDIWELVKLGG